MEIWDDASIETQAEIFRVIGHPVRLRIIKTVIDGELPVSQIVGAVSAKQSNVSRHLVVLKQSGILTHRKSGLRVYYRVATPERANIIRAMIGHAAALAVRNS